MDNPALRYGISFGANVSKSNDDNYQGLIDKLENQIHYEEWNPGRIEHEYPEGFAESQRKVLRYISQEDVFEKLQPVLEDNKFLPGLCFNEYFHFAPNNDHAIREPINDEEAENIISGLSLYCDKYAEKYNKRHNDILLGLRYYKQGEHTKLLEYLFKMPDSVFLTRDDIQHILYHTSKNPDENTKPAINLLEQYKADKITYRELKKGIKETN